MAPKKDSELLIGVGKQGNHDAPEVNTLPERDGVHVIVVPAVNAPLPHRESGGKGNRKDKIGGGKQCKESGGPETPKNCPHLETALFFFGIAGMIVSLIMLLLHFLRKITPYY